MIAPYTAPKVFHNLPDVQYSRYCTLREHVPPHVPSMSCCAAFVMLLQDDKQLSIPQGGTQSLRRAPVLMAGHWQVSARLRSVATLQHSFAINFLTCAYCLHCSSYCYLTNFYSIGS